jgi:two-component system, sensor kinase
VQEALTNVARHSKAGEAIVRVSAKSDLVEVRIEDRGTGFDPQLVLSSSLSVGLTGMRERALVLGGRLTIETSPGKGTRLTAELPLRA